MKLKPILIAILCFYSSSFWSQSNEFVRIEGKHFKKSAADFFPIVANYVAEITHGSGTLSPNPFTFPYNYPTRGHEYFTSNTFSQSATNATDGYNVMLNDFKDIQSIGFNAVRVCGACDYGNLVSLQELPWLSGDVMSYTTTGCDELRLDITANILQAAKTASLKVILLVDGLKSGAAQTSYTTYLSKLAQRFKYDPTLMAVDFVNEPDISTGVGYNKTGSCTLTASWNNVIKGYSQILTTVGLYDAYNSTFNWDPNTLNVDFASFHPYPIYENPPYPDLSMSDAIERIKSQFFWYTNNLSVPWILGETSVSAHTAQTIPVNTSLDPSQTAATTSLQASYLDATIKACRDYGGAGYSWWTYMDRNPNVGSKDFLGVVECDQGNTGTVSIAVQKPAAAAIYSFNPASLPSPYPSTVVPSNYFTRFTPNSNFKLTGTVQANGSGVKDAIVRMGAIYTPTCGSCPGDIGRTFTDSQGQFTVYAYNSISTTSITSIELDVSAVDANAFTDYKSISGGTANITYTPAISLTKISRPTNSTLAYANQTVTGVSINTAATSYITYTNYVINSGTVTVRAAEYINLNPGFSAVSGSQFNAIIGPYYHDCSTLVDGNNNPFRVADNPGKLYIKQTNLPEIQQSSYLYPNPGIGIYNIRMDEDKNYELDIYNTYGAQIKTVLFSGKECSVDISEANPGIYLFNVISSKKLIGSWKVIKE